MTGTSADEPSINLYFEDHVPGLVHVFGSVLVEEQEMRDFAERYDPQVFHTDPEAAKKTSFGGGTRRRVDGTPWPWLCD